MTNFFVGRRRRENGEKGKKGKNEILKKIIILPVHLP
jgi:hypothetical protein